jgi:phenylacetate-CoA ligase
MDILPLFCLVKFLQKRKHCFNLRLSNVERCVVTSEMLFEEDKLLMENNLQFLINEYGASNWI